MAQRLMEIPAALAVLAFACALVLPSAALADQAATIYDPDTVFVIHLTLEPQGIAELEAEPEEYAATKGEFTIAATDGTPGTEHTASEPKKVEIRLKGSSSFEDLEGKAAFKLKFPKGERPFELKKMTLNNMVQDGSMTHETMAYEAFRAAGVPAPRTGFAYVYLNGIDYGMHLDVETLDDQSLENTFGIKFDKNTQHLYEGEDGADLVPGDATAFQVDEGDEANIADLEALIGAVGGSGPSPWSAAVAPYADLSEMTRMWAVEKYVGQWDGYSGQEGEFQPNNYYLYDDPLGQFQMLPWGTDETFMAEHHLPFDGPAGVMFNKCLEDPNCFETYRHSLDDALAPIDALDLPDRALALDSMLAPWQEEEEGNGSRHVHSRGAAHAAALHASQFAGERRAEAQAWLAAHAPPVEEGEENEEESREGDEGGDRQGDEGGDHAGSSGGSGIGAAPGLSLPSEQPHPVPHVLWTHFADDAIRTDLVVPSGGAVVGQRATYRVGKHRRTACVVPATPRPAGEVVIQCHLRPAARAHLRHGDLDLHIATKVRPTLGALVTFNRSVTLQEL